MTSAALSPVRVAIIGAGPAGFYAAEYLLRSESPIVEVDLFDRLPTPFGLVRSGVAPDHQKIKSVTRVFEKVATHERFRFFGNVCFGEHLTLADFEDHYHQILFTTGAQSDRRLGIPGEDLAGSHSATEFVAWYNGHPDFGDLSFDLTHERAVVVGVGNVAIDVARILCRTQEELAQTDIADYALEALKESRIREVVMLGRRGPAQAAFTYPEVKELGEMVDADVATLPEEVDLDPLSAAALAANPDRTTEKIVARLQEYAQREPGGRSRRIVLRFLASPTEILGDGEGKVRAIRIVKNELVEDERGDGLRPRATQYTEQIPAGVIFRSVGYRGVPLADIPFREDWAIIPNDAGRVLAADGKPSNGLYVAGWIKRGPSGVIGTNKPDAQETGRAMLEDAALGRTLKPKRPTAADAERFITERRPEALTYDDWRRIDAHEIALGATSGRPRVKLCSLDDMFEALGRKVQL
ncbi:FAD-dependent oxidoreductase [soil metagenome]